MDHTSSRGSTLRPVVFRDGLGQRHRVVDAAGAEKLEVLCLHRDLATAESFETALRERAGRLAGLHHAYFARFRTVERLSDPAATLVVVSEPTPGVRLSDLLATAERHGLALDSSAGLCLIRQVVSAVAMFHEQVPDIAHGAIAPERIMITPTARLVVVEHVLGSALEHLRFSQDRYWKELRIACPRSGGLPHLGHRADVTQIGVVALSLILGRPLRDDEYPARLEELIESAKAVSAGTDSEPISPGLRSWLARALQLDARNGFVSAIEARAELDRTLDESGDILAPSELEAFLARCQDCREQQIEGELARPAVEVPVNPQAKVLVAPVPPPAILLSGEAPNAPPVTTMAPMAPEPLAPRLTGRPRRRSWKGTAAATGLLTLLTGAGGMAARRYFGGAAERTSTGTLAISTSPPGAQVVVDGEPRGTTPVNLTMKSGAHAIELRGSGDPRMLSVTVTPGAVVTQYIELATPGPSLGQLLVRTDPAGASVMVDGTHRGTSPLTIGNLSAGEHVVVLENAAASAKQTVTIEPGTTASIIAQLGAPQTASSSGWITVSAPNDVQIYESGSLIGSSQSDRIMMAAGTHQLELVNEALGYRSARAVQVTSGKVSPIRIEFPKGTIAVNAIPWAVVWIDGENVGETPIGNLPVNVGTHEIVFRHPDLGEKRQVATVSLTAATRLSVDLRKQ